MAEPDPWAAFPDAAPAAGDPWAQFPDAPPGTAEVVRQSAAPAIAPAPAAPPPEERSLLETYLTGPGTALAQGFNSGLATMAGLPVEIINRLPRMSNLMRGGGLFDPISENPVGGIDSIKDAGVAVGELAGTEVYEPQNLGERIAGRVGQELGAQAVPLAGMAATGARLGVQGARAAGPVTRFFAEPFAVNPGRAVAEEVAAGIASGVGAQAGREIFGQDSAGGDLAGSLAGAGLYGVGRAVVPAAGDVLGALTGSSKFASDTTKAAVADTIIGNSDTLGPQMAQPGAVVDTDPLVAALSRQPDVERVIPGFQATTAEAAGDAGLSALEVARARGSPRAGAFSARQDANTQAIDTRLGELAPTEQPGAFSAGLEGYRARRTQDAAKDLGEAQRLFEDAAGKLRAAQTGEARGATIRNALDGAKAAAREVENQAWKAAGVDGKQADVRQLSDIFDTIADDLTDAERQFLVDNRFVNIPAGWTSGAADAAPGPLKSVSDAGRRMFGATRPNDAPVLKDLREVTSLRSELNDEIRRALSGADADPNQARVLTKFVEGIDGYLRRVAPEAAAGIEEARKVSFDLNERFTRAGDPVAKVLQTRQGGRFATPDSAVAPTFVQPDEGQASNIERLLGEADTPDVRGAIRDQILSEGGNARMLENPQRIEDYIAGRGQVLDRVPDARADLQRGASTRRGVMRAEQQAADTAAEVGPGGSGPVAKYLRYGDENASKAMRSVLNSDRPAETMDKLLGAAGGGRATEGAKRAFWDVMEEEGRSKVVSAQTTSGTRPWVPARWKAFIDKPPIRAAINRLYADDPEHFAAIDEIAGALKATNANRNTAVARNPSGTQQAQRGAGITLAETQAKFADVQRGRLSKAYFVTYMAGRLARRAVRSQSEAAFSQLLDDALLDREKALALLTDYNPANRAAMARKLRTWYGDRAGTLIELLDEDDEQSDPVVDAVMGVP